MGMHFPAGELNVSQEEFNMGSEPYFYFVDYQRDFNAALQELRQSEFNAGRYNPVISFLDFPIDEKSPSPGAQHKSIKKAIRAADASGTRSILDIERIAEKPDYGVASQLQDEKLLELYGTTKPTHDMIEKNMDFFEDMERGQGIYIIVYKNNEPSEIFFAGYSYD
jgi:hypothetical protein